MDLLFKARKERTMKAPEQNVICMAAFYEDTCHIYVRDDTVDAKYPVYTLAINHPTNYWAHDYDTLEEALESFAGEVASYYEAGNWEVIPQ